LTDAFVALVAMSISPVVKFARSAWLVRRHVKIS
jgi:hypothetical protein